MDLRGISLCRTSLTLLLQAVAMGALFTACSSDDTSAGSGLADASHEAARRDDGGADTSTIADAAQTQDAQAEVDATPGSDGGVEPDAPADAAIVADAPGDADAQVTPDARADAAVDAARDADAGAAIDAAGDAEMDAALDAATDAEQDAAIDAAGEDAQQQDAEQDVATDSGADGPDIATIGCGDGIRRGFTSVTDWPHVAACGTPMGYPEAFAAAATTCASGWHMCTYGEVDLLTGPAPDFVVPDGGASIGGWLDYTAGDEGHYWTYDATACSGNQLSWSNLSGTDGCTNAGDWPEGWRLAVWTSTWSYSHSIESIQCVAHAGHACGYTGGSQPVMPQYTLCCATG